MKKPALTQAVISYAMKQAQRLKELYPNGLSSRDLSHELNLTVRSARNVMSRRGFVQEHKHYAIGDVAAILAFRHWRRSKEIKERTI